MNIQIAHQEKKKWIRSTNKYFPYSEALALAREMKTYTPDRQIRIWKSPRADTYYIVFKREED
jgi:hypothetical protein